MACLTQAPSASAICAGVRRKWSWAFGLGPLVFGLWSLVLDLGMAITFSDVLVLTDALFSRSAGVSPAAVTNHCSPFQRSISGKACKLSPIENSHEDSSHYCRRTHRQSQLSNFYRGSVMESCLRRFACSNN